MKFTATAAALVGAAAVQATTPVATVTVITTDYEYYCPGPTTFIHKNATYTATTETTITITNCPCTVTTIVPPPITTSVPGTAPGASEVPTVVQPPPTTSLIGVTPIPGTPNEPTKLPTGPSGVPTEIPANVAQKLGTGLGALAMAAAAFLVL